MANGTTRHTRATRIAHAGLAIAVATQLATSLIMRAPRADRAGDLFFQAHSYSGLAAMAFVALFWLVVVLRTAGTDAGLLMPWFSAPRRRALVADLRETWAALRSFRLPPYAEAAPFSAAIHGLGLLLMTTMAATGTFYFLTAQAGVSETGPLALAMEVHTLLANLVWAYLIGHALMALLHHYGSDHSLAEMWSLRRTPQVAGGTKK
jgi:cytochrome b561